MRLLLLLILIQFSVSAQTFNEFIVKEANKFSGGTYQWSGSGCPVDLVWKDQKLLEKSPVGSHCSGFTFTILFNAMKEHQLFGDLSIEELKKFQNHWYGNTTEAAETQCQYALCTYKLGKEITIDHAKPGDFVQFWRNNKTGHSVIFLAWIKDEKGKITGLKYRSSQKLTNGIGDRIENVGSEPKDINLKRVYIVRLGS